MAPSDRIVLERQVLRPHPERAASCRPPPRSRCPIETRVLAIVTDSPVAIARGLHRDEVDGRVAEQARDIDVGGRIVDDFRPVALHDPALEHDDDAVGQRHGLLVVLGDVEHGRAGAAQQVRQLEPHLVAQLGVDVAQRIVEQQDLGLSDEGARERRALLLAVRQLLRAGGP